MSIVVFSEQAHLLPETLTWARKLGAEIHAALLEGFSPQEAGRYGAKKVHILRGLSRKLVPQLYARALVALAEQTGAQMLIFPATKTGRETAARVAQALKTGCANDCLELDVREDRVKVVRQVYGGGYLAEQVLRHKPYIVSIQPGRIQPTEAPTEFEVSEMETEKEAGSKLVGAKPVEKSGVDLEKAELIVSVGRGFKKKEDLKLAEELAEVLGAEVGCSRPIAGDLRWLPEDRHIGLSGKRVRPKLYLALGISGQIQHLVGMRDSKLVVSVNIDPNAPMNQEADYAVVADLYKFVPELIEALRRELKRQGGEG